MWSSRRRTLEVERSRQSRSNLDSHSGVRAPTTLEQALRATLIEPAREQYVHMLVKWY